MGCRMKNLGFFLRCCWCRDAKCNQSVFGVNPRLARYKQGYIDYLTSNLSESVCPKMS